MQSLSLRYDTLIELATFLVRRWSEDDKITVEMSPRKEITTKLRDKRVILIPIEDYQGDDFTKYRLNLIFTLPPYDSVQVSSSRSRTH